MNGKFESWGIPALENMKTVHPDFAVTRFELAKIIEESIERLKKDGRRLPKWVLGNLIADINERTLQKYNRSRPTKNVCFYCLGTGENPVK